MKSSDIQQINQLTEDKEKFFILIDYLGEAVEIYTTKDLKQNKIQFNFKEAASDSDTNPEIKTTKALSMDQYKSAFRHVKQELQYGNSYLVNLTFAVPIESKQSLEEIYKSAHAKYKVHLPNNFSCFSPETFIKITDNKISTYPMKGTAKEGSETDLNTIIKDQKEIAEHATVVDLLRNDLSTVANDVTVQNYRYTEQIKSADGSLHFQNSSEISGTIKADFQNKLGNILANLLPAGSVTGAPKAKTIQIIQAAENYNRGFYTGIAGYFDGENFDSCVLIRYIEKTPSGLVFKSGGGITAASTMEKEYQELLDKIYVPVDATVS